MASSTDRGADLPAELLSLWQNRFRAGNLHDCETLARRLIGEYPDAGKAWQLLGTTLLAAGCAADAVSALQRASILRPQDWSIWDSLGIALQRQADFSAAAHAFRTSLKRAPGHAAVWSNASANELASGNSIEALRLAREAIRLDPRLAAAHLNAGNALSASGLGDEAEAAFRQALSLQPRLGEALLSLGRELGRRGQFADAAETTRRALAINPDYADAHLNLANYLNSLGDVDSAVAHYRRALALKPDMISAWSGALFCLLHDDRQSPQMVAAAHREFGASVEASNQANWQRHSNVADPDRRLRLGFVSGDLRDHPVARFLELVWRRLDKAGFELFAYDVQPGRDDVADRLRKLTDHWIEVPVMSDAHLDALIRRDGIDILFDLSGHTARNRLGLFARRPAPVQISWLGYPGTTGLSAIDYRFVDQAVAPPGRFDDLFTERLAYLPFMSVFDPPANLPEIGKSPAIENGYLTFGSFNRVNKLGRKTLELWAGVLKRAPRSRLLIGALPNEEMGADLARFFLDAGIDEARLTFRRRMGLADYLELHAQVDILLDTVPFSSGTTANFALWMGVPTLTLSGNSIAQRLGMARMTAAGLDGFVAESEEEYLDLAARWSQQMDPLARLRAELRGRMQQNSKLHPLMLTTALEKRLREMWQRWCLGLAPERLL